MIVIYIALLAAFLILLAQKLGGVEWLQVHGCRLLSEMAHCTFCLSWWACVGVAIVWAVAVGNASLLLVPFMAAPLTRFLI